MPRPHEPLIETDQSVTQDNQLAFPVSYPLLEAFEACQSAADVERTLGAEHGQTKREYQSFAQPVAQMQSQQRYVSDDHSVLRLAEDLAGHQDAMRLYEAKLRAIQERRVEANKLMVSTYAAFVALQQRAKAAIARYRTHSALSENDPNALVRYQARLGMSTSYQILTQLVGPAEATSVLTDGAKPAWLK